MSEPCSSSSVSCSTLRGEGASPPRGTPEQMFELKMGAASNVEQCGAMSRKQEPRPHYEQGLPRPQCIPVYPHIPLYTIVYPVYPGIPGIPRPHYEDLPKNLPAANPDLQMAPVFT